MLNWQYLILNIYSKVMIPAWFNPHCMVNYCIIPKPELAISTQSPFFRSSTCLPIATTSPTPSLPPTVGKLGLMG